jgi:hypothetical protein
MESGLLRLKNKKLISNIVEAMEKKMNDLIEENKQLKKTESEIKNNFTTKNQKD